MRIADQIKSARIQKNIHKSSQQKILWFPDRLFLIGKMEFPKQKDIRNNP